jgi:protein-S-isoprenylcysteine O-methyltransferase Ste14
MLELKIPPPVVTLMVGALMWLLSNVGPHVGLPFDVRLIASLVIALPGAAIALAGVRTFRRAGTTTNPLKPAGATSLVTSGVYRFTRNPMYLGLAFVLVGWAVFLDAVVGFIGPVAFVLYMTRFQIIPEERILLQIFADDFRAYRERVRRWL